MTKDDIIRMAREAGISKPWDQEPVKWETLGRFAALVYTQGHKDGLDDFEAGVLPAAIKAEREACAKVAVAVMVEEQQRMAKELKTQREWQGLTDDEVNEAAHKCVKSGQSVNAAIRAIESKLKEKNAPNL